MAMTDQSERLSAALPYRRIRTYTAIACVSDDVINTAGGTAGVERSVGS